MKAYQDQDVVLGLRPENIGSQMAETDTGAPRIRAVVDVIEPMGSDTFVYLSMNGKTFVSRVDADHSLRVGEEANLAIQTRNLHFFDRRTETSILDG